MQSPAWGAQGNLQISYLDANQTVGFSNNFPTSWPALTGQTCSQPNASAQICGTWFEYCSPVPSGLLWDSVNAIFSYDGPTAADGEEGQNVGLMRWTALILLTPLPGRPFQQLRDILLR